MFLRLIRVPATTTHGSSIAVLTELSDVCLGDTSDVLATKVVHQVLGQGELVSMIDGLLTIQKTCIGIKMIEVLLSHPLYGETLSFPLFSLAPVVTDSVALIGLGLFVAGAIAVSWNIVTVSIR